VGALLDHPAVLQHDDQVGVPNRGQQVCDHKRGPAGQGLSPRAVHAHLIATVGLAPKRALRIQRLLAALRYAGGGRTLSAAALAAGYSDQAHFTRDARQLLGEPPAAWRRRATDGHG